MSAKLKQYGLLLVGVIATLHIGHTFMKPLLLPPNAADKRKANQEYLEGLKKI